MNNPPESLREKMVKSLGAVVGMQLFKKIFSFAISIILYRFLSSDDFGLYALAESYLMFALIFSDMGIEDAVIQSKAKDPSQVIQTGFVLRVFFASVSFLIIFLFADFFAALVKTPQLALPLRAVSLTVLANLIAFKTEMAFKKGLTFERFIIPETLSQVASAILTFILALNGFGYWSLVVSTLSNQFFRTFFLSLQQREKISFEWDEVLAKKILSKSFYSVMIILLYFALSRLVQFIVADRFGLARVGFFYLAFNWSNFFVTYAVQFANRVIFPAVSTIGSDHAKVVKAYYEYLHRVSFFAVIFSVGLLVLAPQLISVILGDKWLPAAGLCQALCIHGLIRALAAPSQTVLYGLGIFKKTFNFLAIELIVFISLIYLLTPLGLNGVIISLILSKIIGFIMPSRIVEKELKSHRVKWNKIIVPYLLAGAVSGMGMVLLGNILEAFHWPDILYLLVEIPFGGWLYLIGYNIFHGKNLTDLTSLRGDLKRLFQAKFLKLFFFRAS